MLTNNQNRTLFFMFILSLICMPLFSQTDLDEKIVIKKKNSSGHDDGIGCNGSFSSDELDLTFILPFSNLQSDANGLPTNLPCDLALQVVDNEGTITNIPLSSATVQQSFSGGQGQIVEVNYTISTSAISAACQKPTENFNYVTLSLNLVCLDGGDPCEEANSTSIYVNGDCDYSTSLSLKVCCEVFNTTPKNVLGGTGGFQSGNGNSLTRIIVSNQIGEIVYTLEGDQITPLQLSELGLNRGLYYISTITATSIETKVYYQVQ